eukprot:m.19387 g.19387  ORF g.19387 m.19387 type:complete len:412 (-) comp8026_c0_seq1:6359-7594(-)
MDQQSGKRVLVVIGLLLCLCAVTAFGGKSSQLQSSAETIQGCPTVLNLKRWSKQCALQLVGTRYITITNAHNTDVSVQLENGQVQKYTVTGKSLSIPLNPFTNYKVVVQSPAKFGDMYWDVDMPRVGGLIVAVWLLISVWKPATSAFSILFAPLVLVCTVPSFVTSSVLLQIILASTLIEVLWYLLANQLSMQGTAIVVADDNTTDWANVSALLANEYARTVGVSCLVVYVTSIIVAKFVGERLMANGIRVLGASACVALLFISLQDSSFAIVLIGLVFASLPKTSVEETKSTMNNGPVRTTAAPVTPAQLTPQPRTTILAPLVLSDDEEEEEATEPVDEEEVDEDEIGLAPDNTLEKEQLLAKYARFTVRELWTKAGEPPTSFEEDNQSKLMMIRLLEKKKARLAGKTRQ